MRGLLEVAALLPFVCSALVIPSSVGRGPLWRPEEVSNNRPGATVEVTVDNLGLYEQFPPFEVRIAGTAKACGESDVQVNGQRLEVQWNGAEGQGHGYLDIPTAREAFWSIICLPNYPRSEGEVSDGIEAVHLLRLRFENEDPRRYDVGFTLSYRQLQSPSIVRLSNRFIDDGNAENLAAEWRKAIGYKGSSEAFSKSATLDVVASSTVLEQNQKGLASSFRAFSASVKEKFGKVVKKLGVCQKFLSKSKTIRPPLPDGVPEDDDLEELTPTTKTADATSTTHSIFAAETRSLTDLDHPSSSDFPLVPDSGLSPPPLTNFHPLKIFGLSLVVVSLLVWLVLRYRDPRWRADRAAQREERRTKRLYRRAAQRQRIRTWFMEFRLRYRLASQETLDSNEKHNRVKDQEEVLETAAQDDIRALRNARRVVSSITAAEEGQSIFYYETEGSHRNRSFSTLPGYDSDSSQPPSYDDSSRLYDRSTLVQASAFQSSRSDSDPDSSVVSTSPRISRDGTNSDFDKIETISLEDLGFTTQRGGV